jgi:hypothetical protein
MLNKLGDRGSDNSLIVLEAQVLELLRQVLAKE